MKENKCEKLKMKHAWEDCTPNVIYATNPPQYPPRQEKCQNCGLVRTYRVSKKEWIEYSDGKERTHEWDDGSITITGELTSITGTGTTTLRSKEV